uniref:Secreted protein n=1 Tax=Steinernema glaseri TaxID=37863 RepID=A0A1I7Y3L9_9BILA
MSVLQFHLNLEVFCLLVLDSPMVSVAGNPLPFQCHPLPSFLYLTAQISHLARVSVSKTVPEEPAIL